MVSGRELSDGGHSSHLGSHYLYGLFIYKGESLMARTNFSSAVQGINEIEITVTGRTSGRSLSYPIWFALDSEKLYLIPVKGSDTEWYKNVRKTPTIRLAARGKTLTASARLITDEAQLDKILEKFRDKYGR